MEDEDLIYLDTYVLQKVMRIRMPKSVITNMNVEKGISRFQIYYDKINESLVLKPENEDKKTNKELKSNDS